MHRCLFPKASLCDTFNLVTNPHQFDIDDCTILGTSGQNVESMRTYCNKTPLEILEKTLLSRNIAPTAPDSCGSFPFKTRSPLVLNQTPHVYFAGNQKEFTSTLHKGPTEDVLLLTIPDFSKANNIVLMNLATMKCETMNFGVDSNGKIDNDVVMD